MKYRRYRSDVHQIAAAEVTTMKGLKVPEGFILEVAHFAAYDESESGNIVALGYLDRTGNFVTLQVNQHTEDYGTNLSRMVWLEAGETPAAKITTPGAADVLSLSCHGKLWPTTPEVTIDAEVQQEDSLPD